MPVLPVQDEGSTGKAQHDQSDDPKPALEATVARLSACLDHGSGGWQVSTGLGGRLLREGVGDGHPPLLISVK